MSIFYKTRSQVKGESQNNLNITPSNRTQHLDNELERNEIKIKENFTENDNILMNVPDEDRPVTLNETKKINIPNFNTSPTFIRNSNPLGNEITFKKSNCCDASPYNQVIGFEVSDDPFDEVIINDEFKNEEIDNNSDYRSVISSNVLSRINHSPRIMTNKNTDFSCASSNYSKSEYGSRFDSINNFPKLCNRNSLEDAEFEITNENSDGFTKFIETPKSKNLFSVSNMIKYQSNVSVIHILIR